MSDATCDPEWNPRIGQLVGQWRVAHRRQRQGISYRSLVSFGRFHQVDPEVYRRQLTAAQMHRSHASRICTILQHPQVATDFVRGRHSFRLALAATRGPALPNPTPPNARFFSRLTQLFQQLQADLQGEPIPTTTRCGLFELQCVPAPPAVIAALPVILATTPAAQLGPRVVLKAAPATAEKLFRLAARSGLNRAETASLLLTRMPFDALLAIFSAAAPVGGSYPATVEHQMQRRINPARSLPDVLTVAVRLPLGVRAQLQDLANRSGLRAGAAANLLLELQPVGQLEAIRAARERVVGQRAATPEFPDLSGGPNP